ncbi:MAG: polysaccharide pyruvyl transferase CsaB [Candidatus Gastranaerophilaceae bacterium]
MSKKVLISGYYGFDNFGDEAVLTVLTKFLKDLGLSEITVFSSNPSKTAENCGVKSAYTFDYPNVVKTVWKNDVLISGGGSLLQDVTSVKSVLYYLFVIFTALIFRKDVVVFAQGIGPINNPFARFLTFFALKKCKLVSVRDFKSLEALKSQGISAEKVVDPVWNLSFDGTKIPGSVGVQLRQFKNLPADFLHVLAISVAENYKTKTVKIFQLQNSEDEIICENFRELLSKNGVNAEIVPYRDVNSAANDLASVETLIAMRFHACLVGVNANVKVLPIVYDKKVKKLADECGLKFRIYPNSKNIRSTVSDFVKSDFSGEKQVFDFSLYEEFFNSK